MHNVVKRTFLLLLVVVAFLGGTVFLALEFVRNADDWVKQSSSPYVGAVAKNYINIIYDSKNNVLLKSETVEDENGEEKTKFTYFSEDAAVRAATLHAVGEANMSVGITKLFNGNPVNDEYSIISGLYDQAKDNTVKDFYLTIDSDVCKKAYNELNGRKGTVGVYNYKTGEIICMVSSPSIDPNNPPKAEEVIEGTYFNKLLSQTYTPGSIFKIVTAACAIDYMPNVYSRSFRCDGELEIEGFDDTVRCNGVHGTLNFEKALNCSCNCVFAQLAIELGKDRLLSTAEKMGFNTSFDMDRHTLKKGSLDLAGAVNIDIGWAGIGQYTTRANPCMMMTLMGAIANGGKAVKPYYVSSTVSSYGDEVYAAQTETVDVIDIKEDTANKLKTLLRSNVVNYYGEGNFPGLQMCGKTGTAEVGVDKDYKNNAWFVGFSQRDDFPYAIVVMIEESSQSASNVAIPVANKVLQSIIGG